MQPARPARNPSVAVGERQQVSARCFPAGADDVFRPELLVRMGEIAL